MSETKWTAARVNDLPDSSFLYVEPGGKKDADGRTTPRILRHFPYRDEDGGVDTELLEAAKRDIDAATDIPEAVRARVRSKAEKVLKDELIRRRESEPEVLSLEKADVGSQVQTLIFEKGKYGDKEAREWALDHGFDDEKVDETENSYRLRQEDPDDFDRLRTVELAPGVKAVVGVRKSDLQAVAQAFLKHSIAKSASAEALAAAEVEPDGDMFRVTCARRTVCYRVTALDAEGRVAEEVPGVVRSRVLKADPEQRYTLGVCYPADAVDAHGEFMTPQELEKAAWKFMGSDGVSKRVGVMHKDGTDGSGEVVESYIYRGPEWKLKDTGGDDQVVKPGDWLLGVVWSPESWEEVKGGKLTGYSLQGLAEKPDGE